MKLWGFFLVCECENFETSRKVKEIQGLRITHKPFIWVHLLTFWLVSFPHLSIYHLCLQLMCMCIFVNTHVGASQVAPVIKNPPADAGRCRDMSLTPGLGRFP